MGNRLTIGLLAHVDAGKTTLAEGMLYTAGQLRNMGRVDHKDAYLQYDVVGSEVKLIGGYRWNLPGDKNEAFGGVALSTPKVMGFDAYASYVAGKDFNETQVGINKNLLLNVDLNVNYHNFKPDNGHRENGVGAGITVKF